MPKNLDQIAAAAPRRSTSMMISIPQPTSDLNGARTSAVKIIRQRQPGQAALTGRILIVRRWCDFGRSVRVEGIEILAHRPGDIFVFRPGGWPAIHFATAAGVRLDHAGIDGETLATDKAGLHALPHHMLEQPPEKVAVAKAPVPVLGERGVVGNLRPRARAGKTSDRPG